MNIFSCHFPRPGGVKSYHGVLKFRDYAPLLTISFWMFKKKNPSHASQKMPQGNADIAMRWFRAGPLSIFDFQKLAGLWLASLIKNHVRIYGSNVAEGFSAFQRRSCLFCTLSLLSLHCVPWQRLQCGIRDHSGYGLSQVSTQKHLGPTLQGWGEYWTYEYEYWKISTRVVLEYNVFSIFMFIILGKTSTRVVLAPALLLSPSNWATAFVGQLPLMPTSIPQGQ